MDLHLPCEDPSINDVIPIWNPTEVANAERQRLQGINFLHSSNRFLLQLIINLLL